MKALIFDLDDTLYDPLVPFARALDQHLDFPKEQVPALYAAFRKQAEETFRLVASGDMLLETSYIRRIQVALSEFGFSLSDKAALAFQEDYATFQGQLDLSADWQAVFTACQEHGIALGVITNGQKNHQWTKMRSLGLEQWMPTEHLIVSGEVGITKPSSAIFRLMEERLSLSPSELCYVGDSFDNDVIGSKQAGWQAVWLNSRGHETPDGGLQPDWTITGPAQLLPILSEQMSGK